MFSVFISLFSFFSLSPLVHLVPVDRGLGHREEQEEERHEAKDEYPDKEEPGLRLVIPQLHHVWEAHEVAEAVTEDRGSQVAGAEEQEGGVHAEDRRVRHLRRN